MPKLDGTGPKAEGRMTGRKLGKCAKNDQKTLLQRLGEGMGLKRRSGGGVGKGRRKKSSSEL